MATSYCHYAAALELQAVHISVYSVSVYVFVGSTTATSNHERSKEELYKRAVTGGGASPDWLARAAAAS